MAQSQSVRSSERIMETMIGLTRLSKSNRVIVAGSDAFDFYVTLHLRGFCNVATTATCRFPCGQHEVALIAGQHSIQALQQLLTRIAAFLKCPGDRSPCGLTLPSRTAARSFKRCWNDWVFASKPAPNVKMVLSSLLIATRGTRSRTLHRDPRECHQSAPLTLIPPLDKEAHRRRGGHL